MRTVTEERVHRRLAAILAADVVEFSRLMGVDEEGILGRLKKMQRETFDPLTKAFGGRIFKLTGDGALVEFGSSVDAVKSAIEIQRALADINRDVAAGERIVLRIGISLGDVIVEGSDLYGNGVNIAARLEQIATPGAICISGAVHDHVRNVVRVDMRDMGAQQVKNIAEPIHAFMIELDTQTANGATASAQGAAPTAKPASGAPKPAPAGSIAVLAFNNMSGDDEQEYFSDGISEDVITDLSKISGLHVIARNSSFVYKGRAVSLTDVGAELGVRHVLEGSVRKAGSRVRVTAQLIDATTGSHVWADRFDRDLTDIFKVQDEITREIVSALRVRLTSAESERLNGPKHAVPIDAYELFLRGREQSWLHTRAGMTTARTLMEKAVAIYPAYAAAQASIAFTHIIDYINGWTDDPEKSLRTGVETAKRAVALDDNDPSCFHALSAACIWTRDLEGGLAAAERCIELSPSLGEGYLGKAHAMLYGGDGAAALETLLTYMRIDPLYPDITLQFVADAYISERYFEAAEATLRERLIRNPQSDTAYVLLATALGHLDRPEESREAWAQVLKRNPGFSVERRRQILPFRDPADFELRLDGLRKAGIL